MKEDEILNKLINLWIKFINQLNTQMKEIQLTGESNRQLLQKLKDSLNVTYNLLSTHFKKNSLNGDLIILDRQYSIIKNFFSLIDEYDSRNDLDSLIEIRELLERAMKLKFTLDSNRILKSRFKFRRVA